MKKNDDESLQSITGISFRNLAKVLEIEDENLYQDSNVFTDDDRSVFYGISPKVFSYFKSLETRSRGTTSLVRFFFDLFVWVTFRLRVLSILLVVTFEVFSGVFDAIKNILIRNLFWGRGNLSKFALQFVSLVVLVILVLSYPYRLNPITLTSLTRGDNPVYAKQDLLKQGSSVSTPKPEDRRSYDPETYIVKNGDTLSKIAQNFSLNTETILWANNLRENSFIRPGDRLIIPPGDGVMIDAKSGDTVASLAKKYNSNPQLIIEANEQLLPLDNFAIRIGDSLFIPDGRPPAPPKPTAPAYSGIVVTRPYTPTNSAPVIPGVGRFLGWPVAKGGTVTQCFSRWHNGIDIADRSYPSLVAAAPGTVTFAGCQSGACPRPGALVGGWGLAWTVIVDHGNGLSTVYGHMNSIYVRSGQYVGAGQALGQMGQTGTAYGVHIHFMLVRGSGWNYTNPAPYMKNHICGY